VQVEVRQEWLIPEGGHLYKKARVEVWQVDNSEDAHITRVYFKKELVL